MVKLNNRLFLLLVFMVFAIANSSAQPRQVLMFNEGWRFYKGDFTGAEQVSYNDTAWRQVDLPHDWSIEGPFDQQWASATAYLPAGIGWYRKTFQLDKGLLSKNLFLYFDGVYKNSEVWINGHYLGKRPNGFIPFQYELTPYVNKTGKNVVSVKVDHSQFADSRWYTGSGIYRNVYLIATNPVHVDLWGVSFSTPVVSLQKGTANVDVTITNEAGERPKVTVECQLKDRKGNVVAREQQQVVVSAKDTSKGHVTLDVSRPSLWSTEHPNLYELSVALKENGKPIDVLTQHVGFRSIRFDKDKGFFLNGENMKIKGVCIHDDAGALGVAVPKEVWARRLKMLKEAGCNSLRMSHNPHADYMYDLADEMGFLVMDEAFDEWEEGKNKWIKGWNVGTPGNDGYHSEFKEWSDRDVKDMVLRNRNHPSIILWSIGNEIDYPNDPYTHEVLNTGRNPQIYGRGYMPNKPAARRLTEIAKQLVADVKDIDTTRPVTAALAGVVMSNEVGYPEVLDVVGYNYQEYRYPDDHKKYPGRVIYGSENGMALNAWQAVDSNDYISAQYLWTGVDYLGEARSWPNRSNTAGLLDLAGFKKPSYYFRQSLWTSKPMTFVSTSLISSSRGDRRSIAPSWNYKEGDSVQVTCFTNCEEAELLLNGKSLGRKTLTNERVISWRTIYEPGILLVKGYQKGKEVSHCALRTFGEAYAITAKADKLSFSASQKDLVQVEIDIVDQNSVPVTNANVDISVDVDGPAHLIGLESGNAFSHEDYKSKERKAYNGKMLAYIETLGKPGEVKVSFKCTGLKDDTLLLRSKKKTLSR